MQSIQKTRAPRTVMKSLEALRLFAGDRKHSRDGKKTMKDRNKRNDFLRLVFL